jgi:TldD protein
MGEIGMLDRRILSDVLAKALQHGGDFADIFVENRVTTLISCEEKKIERVKTGIDSGAGVRVVYGDTTAYAYTNTITADELLKVADVASRAARRADRDVSIDLRQIEPTVDLDVAILPDAVAIDDKRLWSRPPRPPPEPSTSGSNKSWWHMGTSSRT